MQLRDFIEAGIAKAGTLTALGKELNLSQQEMTNAKAHRRGLPMTAVSKLHKFIECDYEQLIAANELVTEKKEEKIKYWLPFVSNALKGWIVPLILSFVTSIVTPTPANALETLKSSEPNTLYYVKSCVAIIHDMLTDNLISCLRDLNRSCVQVIHCLG